MLNQQLQFWNRHPALKTGISALLGIMNPWIGSVWISFLLILKPSKAWIQAALLIAFSFYAKSINLPETKSGTFKFNLHSIQHTSSPFQTGWLYKGTIDGLPCSISYYKKEERPLANCDYLVTGTLEKRDLFNYAMKVTKWEKIPNSRSLAEFRCSIREKLRSLLQKKLAPNASAFLIALFTGEKENRKLSYQFARVGVQHILAISGFHFALIATFATFALRQFLSSKIRTYTLLFIGLAYFLFIGDSPPVFRSFCALSLFLIGKLIHRPTSGLNTLGACLFIELALNPLVCYTIGFQLSFLSCLGILLLFNPIKQILNPLLPARSLKELKQLSLPAQCAAPLLATLKNALIITLTVNLALWPILLFHFHRFPLLSLLYNLFVPELSALVLALLLLSLAFHAISTLFSLPAFQLTNFLTKTLLDLVAHPPAPIDYQLCFTIPIWFVVLYLGMILLINTRRSKS